MPTSSAAGGSTIFSPSYTRGAPTGSYSGGKTTPWCESVCHLISLASGPSSHQRFSSASSPPTKTYSSFFMEGAAPDLPCDKRLLFAPFLTTVFFFLIFLTIVFFTDGVDLSAGELLLMLARSFFLGAASGEVDPALLVLTFFSGLVLVTAVDFFRAVSGASSSMSAFLASLSLDNEISSSSPSCSAFLAADFDAGVFVRALIFFVAVALSRDSGTSSSSPSSSTPFDTAAADDALLSILTDPPSLCFRIERFFSLDNGMSSSSDPLSSA
mmetsp:Transcript_358/g.1199  ORF Transcript_358/g.1199 Transcript_358/m.1199 type:complete len:270 (+) Transcript_358:1916-2725(+)